MLGPLYNEILCKDLRQIILVRSDHLAEHQRTLYQSWLDFFFSVKRDNIKVRSVGEDKNFEIIAVSI